MASAGGHWLNLAEAQKLTQNYLVPGVVDEDFRRGAPASYFQLVQVAGQNVAWNRTNAVRTGRTAAVGDKLTNVADISYTQNTRALKIIFDQSLLDNYVEAIYGTVNNYKAIRLVELQRSVLKKLNNDIFYGNTNYTTNEMYGLHALAEDNGTNTTSDLDIEQSGALSVFNIRKVLAAMKYGCDAIFLPYRIKTRLDAAMQEAGYSSFAGPGRFGYTPDEVGRGVTAFDGVPLIPSDYLTITETADTGQGSNAKLSTGGSSGSLLFVKFGNPVAGDPGVALAFGGGRNEVGQLFRAVLEEDHPDYDADQLRLIGYMNIIDGSGYSVGRIDDVTDAAVVV